jgi:hypothetical protein
VVPAFVVVAIVAASCSAKGDSIGFSQNESASDPGSTAAGSADPPPDANGGAFGDLGVVCGPEVDGVELTVESSEAGATADKLSLGVASDRTNQLRPGLFKELYDAGIAFATWCNDHGGIGGLELEVVDIDGRLLEVEQAMATACAETFALVGGGLTQDVLVFSGKPDTDFEECGLIAYPAIVFSERLALHDNVVQANPNTPNRRASAFFEAVEAMQPGALETTSIVWPELETFAAIKDQLAATGALVPGFGAGPEIGYDILGTTDWNLVAQRVISSGATAVDFIGEPGSLSRLSEKLSEQQWDGVLFSEFNQYDDLLIQSSGPEAVEGIVITNPFQMHTDPDPGSAAEQMVEIMETHGPSDSKIASFTTQAFTSWLLFAEAAKACGAANDGLLTRQCVVDAGRDIDVWTGGGLHAVTGPADNEPVGCTMLVTVDDGEWVQAFPERGSADDAGDGFYCPDIGIVDLPSTS